MKRVDKTIFCRGPHSLFGTTYKIFPDMIEALTYATSVGICKGDVLLTGVIPEHLSYVSHLYKDMGFDIAEGNGCMRVKVKEPVSGCSVTTAPYPLFPTDLHPQLSALLCFSENGGSICDEVFPTRFAYANELSKMNASITRIGNSVSVKPSHLIGSELDATDLRAGAALVLAGLGAQGSSKINNVNYIVRGYESLVDKIAAIGGKIKLIKEN